VDRFRDGIMIGTGTGGGMGLEGGSTVERNDNVEPAAAVPRHE
jgi:hypothetical protein